MRVWKLDRSIEYRLRLELAKERLIQLVFSNSRIIPWPQSTWITIIMKNVVREGGFDHLDTGR